MSTASSLYSSAEEKQAHELRKLRRELLDAQEKVHSLTSQLSTNVSTQKHNIIYTQFIFNFYNLILISVLFEFHMNMNSTLMPKFIPYLSLRLFVSMTIVWQLM